MLSETALQLLTAYVDGVLSSRQRKMVARLVQKSPEARQILKDLQDQSKQLQQLPQRQLDPAFAGEVVAAIQSQNNILQPTRPALVLRRRMPSWARYAVAASLLAVLIGGVWLANRRPEQPSIAEKPAPKVIPHIDHGPLAAKIAEGTFGAFASKPVLPDRAGPKLAFEELAKTQWQEHFVVEMGRQRAVHLDVTVTNQRQAAQRLETVLQNKGIRVERDPRVAALLNDRDKQSPTEFVIYAENIRADELAAMLYELGTDERARTSIEGLTVSNLTDDDQKRLGRLLGISADDLRDPATNPKLPLGTFIPKEEQKPASNDPAPVRSASGSDTRIAMVLANEARDGKLSSQVQFFVNQRRTLQPGTLQVLVVVHRA